MGTWPTNSALPKGMQAQDERENDETVRKVLESAAPSEVFAAAAVLRLEEAGTRKR